MSTAPTPEAPISQTRESSVSLSILADELPDAPAPPPATRATAASATDSSSSSSASMRSDSTATSTASTRPSVSKLTKAEPYVPSESISQSPLYNSLVQKGYNPPFLSPSVFILHSHGTLKKFSSKLTTSSLSMRHFLLTNHSLQYLKSDPFAKPQGTINLTNALLASEPLDSATGLKPTAREGTVFSITTSPAPGSSPRKYVLVSESVDEKNLWLDLISPSTKSTRTEMTAQPNDRWEDDNNLVVEGWLSKCGSELKSSNWNKRYFVYRRSTHTLLYFKSTLPRAAGFVPVEPSAIVDVVGKANTSSNSELVNFSSKVLASLPPGIDSLSILAYTQSEERCYVLLAANKQERDDWMQALNTAIAYANKSDTTTRSYDKNALKKTAVASSGLNSAIASNLLAAAVGTTSSTTTSSSTTSSSSSSSTSSTSSSTSSATASPAAPSTAPTRNLPSPKALSPTSPRGNAPVSTIKPISPITPAINATTAVTADADDDEWSDALMGRKKGESVAYVNLAAKNLASGASSGTPMRSLPALGGNKTGSALKTPEKKDAAGGLGKLAEVSEDDEEDEEEEEAGPSSPVAKSSDANNKSPAKESIDSTTSTAASTPSHSISRSSNLNIVEKTVLELYSTESTYVGILRTISSQYLLRLKKHMELHLEPKWMDESEYASITIFQHVETIRDLNTRLLKELEEIQAAANANGLGRDQALSINNGDPTPTRALSPSNFSAPNTPSATSSSLLNSPTNFSARRPSSMSQSGMAPGSSRILSSLGKIGACFRQYIPFLKVYTLFAQSYDEQLKSLEQLADRRVPLKQFLLLTDTCEGTTLASLMITPVQRIGRYVLLLETILRNSPEGFEGTNDIESALSEMKKVGTQINETVALWEAKSKVVELQSKIDIDILAPGRFLVREGVLKKVYNRAKSEGFFSGLGKKQDSFSFFLFSDVLIQCKRSQLGERYTHRVTMPLDSMVIEDVADDANSNVKNSWTITYSTSSSSAPVIGMMRGSEIDLQTSPLASMRPPSIAVPAPVVPATAAATEDRKTLTLYAASAAEKAKWLADLQSLITQTQNNKKTLMIK